LNTLQDILYKVAIVETIGTTDIHINGITIDSRNVTTNDVFVAIHGVQSNGHSYISKAIELGATCIICEQLPDFINDKVTYIKVNSSAVAAGIMAHNFYGQPSTKLKLVGVTGTNGKTTIATVLFNLFSQLGYTCGLISTVQNQIGDTIIPATHTTPDAINLNKLLAQMLFEGCTYVFMEVSSHAVIQNRIAGLQFTGALFSNITQDHLDFHLTFSNYINAKKAFFDALPNTAFAITNIDDKNGNVMLQNTKAKKYTYALHAIADFKAKIIDNALTGLQLMIDNNEVHFRLIGEFNAYNLLAVYGAAICLGMSKQEVLEKLSATAGAEGRFEYTISPKEKIITIVDYAHTPDALENVLSTIKKLNQHNSEIITVVGCGGDRDKTKRPLMAAAACKWSSQVIFTSDNPRTENPNEILQDMVTGLQASFQRKYTLIPDRKEAIKAAVKAAKKEDIILIAGKGHEKYQEINGVKYEFDDKVVVDEMINIFEK
jgi:UDP-N-acetylmuramoyl-L-alanyl-D-glutamate--2,6-diaminopimelate ligase